MRTSSTMLNRRVESKHSFLFWYEEDSIQSFTSKCNVRYRFFKCTLRNFPFTCTLKGYFLYFIFYAYELQWYFSIKMYAYIIKYSYNRCVIFKCFKKGKCKGEKHFFSFCIFMRCWILTQLYDICKANWYVVHLKLI